MRKSLALAMVAGTLGTVALAQEARPPTPPQGDPAPLVSEKPMNIRPDDKGQSGDLREIAGRSGRVFEGALLRKTTSTPPGMRVLVTEYTFEVHEWFKGGAPQGAERVVVVRETGGVDPNSPDGSGMCTVESHKLTPAGRYLVFLRPDAQDVLFPFDRIFQVFDAGAKVADEHGRVAIGLREGVPLVRETPEVPGLSYLGTTPPNPARPDMGAPRTDYQTRPTLPAPDRSCRARASPR